MNIARVFGNDFAIVMKEYVNVPWVFHDPLTSRPFLISFRKERGQKRTHMPYGIRLYVDVLEKMQNHSHKFCHRWLDGVGNECILENVGIIDPYIIIIMR